MGAPSFSIVGTDAAYAPFDKNHDLRLNAKELENTPPELIAALIQTSIKYADAAPSKNALDLSAAATLVNSLSDDKQTAVMIAMNDWPAELEGHQRDFGRALYQRQGPEAAANGAW